VKKLNGGRPGLWGYRFSLSSFIQKITIFSIMTSVINNPWKEWTIFREQERDEILSQVADINKGIERCNEVILAHKPKPATQGNAWQSKTMLRAKASTPKLTPAQERDAALVLRRKQEEEQRDENRKAQTQGRKPDVLYPELGGLQWIQGHGKRAAMDAGLAQNAARIAASAAEIAAKTPLVVAQKELVSLENSLKKFNERLSKVDCDISHFTQQSRNIYEGEAWSKSGFKGDTPAYIIDAQKRWDADMDSKLDTSLPLRGNPAFGTIVRSWRPGHEPNAVVSDKQPFSWEDFYSSEDEDEEEDELEPEEGSDEYSQ